MTRRISTTGPDHWHGVHMSDWQRQRMQPSFEAEKHPSRWVLVGIAACLVLWGAVIELWRACHG